MTVFTMRSRMRVAATMPRPFAGRSRTMRANGADAGNTGGRSKCLSGRQSARTGRVGDSDGPWDNAASRKIHSACGTQAKDCFCGGPE